MLACYRYTNTDTDRFPTACISYRADLSVQVRTEERTTPRSTSRSLTRGRENRAKPANRVSASSRGLFLLGRFVCLFSARSSPCWKLVSRPNKDTRLTDPTFAASSNRDRHSNRRGTLPLDRTRSSAFSIGCPPPRRSRGTKRIFHRSGSRGRETRGGEGLSGGREKDRKI